MPSRLEPVAGVVDGVNRDFSVPTHYRADSLVVFLNGQQLKRELENGWVELDPDAGTFRMKLPPLPSQGAADDPGDVLYAYYDTEVLSTGGADGGVPSLSAAVELVPKLLAATNLRPRIIGAKEVS